MSAMEEDWKEVGEVLEGLALKLKMHAEQAQSAASEELERSVDHLRGALDDTFKMLREVTNDPALKEDVREGGQRLSDALFNTFSEMGATIRNALPTSDRDTGGTSRS